ncbi:hypothetical protein CHF27_011245 [Romboutsia maritimum]|uniref:Gp28/Gp37-like domain-containing protein n=1 Tax=Romboutsia maritimum TaxID=2020948 RepID=A0A371IQX3_9FIRM|nr:siphovirus ReqiPepy6 Gp37-like family protein [Romboutsia maritimum]RDY22887.1 hypothetical protein CHF27_011245 [Romboutsia maritimum]
MELYVLDTNFNRLGVIDKYECLIWERNYYKSSTFSMQIIPNFEQFNLLKKGNILLKRDNTKEAMFIEHKELEENEEGVEKLVVQGFSLTQWLDRRITLYKQQQKANAETVMRNYVNINCINPADTNRKISNFVNGIDNKLCNKIDYLSHYKPLLEELQSIAETNELGYRVDLDLINKEYIFEVYQGLDRTNNQEVNSKAIFSTEFENINKQKYVESDNNYRNMVLVAGAGEDANRKTLSLGIENKDLDRYELFVDARDISDTRTQGGEECPLDADEYNSLLEQRGKEKLSEFSRIKTFDCELLNVNSLKYRIDYDLGDKVSIINKKWGLMLNERITTIEETYNEEGLEIKLTIGNNIPTIIDKIKNKMR